MYRSRFATVPVHACCFLVCGAVAVCFPLRAQETGSTGAQLEEVLVTATKIEESLQRVPVSIVSYGREQLEASGARTLADVAAMTPGVDFTQNSGFGAASANVAVRGISSTTSTPTTAIYLDELSLASRTNLMTQAGPAIPRTFDIDRVEVLRGPQGTLFGASAEGGAIRFIPAAPDMHEFQARTRAEVGTIDGGGPSYEIGGAAGGPIVPDQLGFRASAYYRHDGGWVDHVTTPLGAGPFNNQFIPGTGGERLESDWNYSGVGAFRLALNAAPSDRFSIQPSVYYQRSYYHTSPGMDLTLSNVDVGAFNSGIKAATPASDEFVLPSAKVQVNLGAVDFTSVTSYFYRSATASTDYTEYQTFAFFGNPWQLLPCLPASSTCQPDNIAHGYDSTHQNKITQELRFASASEQATFSWLAGIYYEHSNQHDTQYVTNNRLAQLLSTYYGVPLATAIPTVLGSPLADGIWVYKGDTYSTDEQISAFAQANYQLTRRLKLTAGVRVEHESNSFNSPLDGPFNGGPQHFAGSQKENPVNPRFGISWQQNDDDMYYASAARGYRPGGSNSQPSTTPTCVAALKVFGLSNGVPGSFNSDSLWSFEVGSKMRTPNQRFQLDVSAYHIVWKNIQTALGINGCGFGAVFNLGQATSNGFDLATEATLAHDFNIGLNVAYVKATYDKTIGAGTTRAITKGDWVGGLAVGDGTLPTPWTLSGHARYGMPIGGDKEGYVWLEDIYRSANPGPVNTQNPADVLSYDALLRPNPSTNRLNMKVGVVARKLDVSLFAQNLLNAHPILSRTHALSGNGSIVDNRISVVTLQPRTVGITATYQF